MGLPFAVDAAAVKPISIAVVVVKVLIDLWVVYADTVVDNAAAGAGRCAVGTAGPIDTVTVVDTGDDDSGCTVIVLLILHHTFGRNAEGCHVQDNHSLHLASILGHQPYNLDKWAEWGRWFGRLSINIVLPKKIA